MKRGALKQAESSSEEHTSQQTGIQPEHESQTHKEVVDRKGAGTITQAEVMKLLRSMINRNGPNERTAQNEVTPWTGRE